MRAPSKSSAFAILMVASAVSAVLLPPTWTGWLRRPFQPLGLGQWAVSSGAREVEAALGGSKAAEVPPAEAARLVEENARLRLQVANQQLVLEDLEREFGTVTGLRDQLPDSHVTIVLAPVVSYDANPRRETLQIALNERTRLLVRKDQWVAAGLRATPSRELVSGQWLIGRISEVQTRLARVQLATDPQFRVSVRLGRLQMGAEGGVAFELSTEQCVLDGQGGGRMLISQAQADHLAGGYDIVVASALREVPVSLVLGRVVDSWQREDSARHYDLEAAPWGLAETLTHVYVISTAP